MKRVLLASLILMVLPGCNAAQFLKCDSGYSRPDFAALRAAVARNKQLWTSKNVQAYEYTYRPVTWWTQTRLRVRVENGTVTLAKPIPNPNDLNPFTPTEAQYLGINELLTGLEQSVASPGDCTVAAFEFDGVYGFPTAATLGDRTRGLADGLGGYQIEEFMVIP